MSADVFNTPSYPSRDAAVLYILERKVCPGHSTLMEFIVGESGIHFFGMPKKKSDVNGHLFYYYLMLMELPR